MSEVFVAVGVMGGMAFLLSLALIWSSKKFFVQENPLIEQVAALLPQANCGACGFPGCAGFARVLVETQDPKMICPVAPNDKLKEIGRVAGIEINTMEPMVAVLHCNGSKDHAKVVSEYIGVRSCVAAHSLYSGDKLCMFSCIGYGDCMKACMFDAIRIENGIALFDSVKCTGCGICVKTCPRKVVSLIRKRFSRVHVACSSRERGALVRKQCKTGCIACGRCARVCPKEAITLEPGSHLARIDDAKCVLCGKCVAECDVMNAIHGWGKVEKAVEFLRDKKKKEKEAKLAEARATAANAGSGATSAAAPASPSAPAPAPTPVKKDGDQA